jgi:hypothetical protein
LYQLTIQFRPWLDGGPDLLVQLEDDFADALGNVGEVDGHDVGSNEANVFILSEEPDVAFSICRPIIEQFHLLGFCSAACRRVDESTYTRLWPLDDATPFVIQ